MEQDVGRFLDAVYSAVVAVVGSKCAKSQYTVFLGFQFFIVPCCYVFLVFLPALPALLLFVFYLVIAFFVLL